MLPRKRRLTDAEDFSAVMRNGTRAGTNLVVVHVNPQSSNPPGITRVGFVVAKKVGGAVERNRVKRRLRHLAVDAPSSYDADVVVRALPGAAEAGEQLATDFHSAWRRAFAKGAIA